MIRKVVCNACGLEIEGLSGIEQSNVFCPNCASDIDLSQGTEVQEIGGYRILDLLGQGGMGQVYRVDCPDGRQVALKVMVQDTAESPELCERFDREMTIMASLEHKNIVRLLDRGGSSLFNFFVMELVDGINLRTLIRAGEIPEPRIADIVRQILQALGYAHSKGIVHRDIKPENILFDQSGLVKVTDFGLARKLLGDSVEGFTLTATNAFMGTENYMSPEQKINPKAVTHKSDIYSLGVVVYEMLTNGMLPLGIFQPPSYYRPIQDFWDGLIFRMLDLNPDMRPANCDEILQCLDQDHAKKTAPAGRTAKSPVVATDGDSPVSGGLSDVFVQEQERIRKKLEEIFQQAFAAFEAKQFDDARKLWEGSLVIVQDPQDRENILAWIAESRKKSEEAQAESGEAILCPACRKPFKVQSVRDLPDEFNCPLCKVILVYDSVRNRILLQNSGPSTIRKVSPSAEITVIQDERRDSSPSENTNRQQFALIAVLGIGSVDWWDPTLLDRGGAWLCDQGLTNLTGLSAGMFLIGIRFILNLVVLVAVTFLAYSLHGWSNRRD